MRSLAWAVRVAGVLAAFGALESSLWAGGPLAVAYSPKERLLWISARDLAGPAHELRIVSSGVSNPEMGAELGEPGVIYLPPEPTPVSPPRAAENIFLFNELAEAEGWVLVIRFPDGANGTWKLNGRFSPRGGEQRGEVAIPVGELEGGENLLHLSGGSIRVPEMYFRREFEAGETGPWAVRMIPVDWSGRVQLWRRGTTGGVEVAEQAIAAAPAAARVTETSELERSDRAQLEEALLAVGRNLLNAQVTRPGSRFEGGFNLVYDPSRKAHRMPHWIWAWGPAIDLLLDLSKDKAAQSAGLALRFRAAALAAGRCSLAFEVTEPGHPAAGLSTVRWEPSRATPLGWAEYISTADSLFMGGWGWMSLYAETREPVYLERMQKLVGATERLMRQFPVIPQDWIVERARWTPHTLDESAFGTIGFRRLFEATRSPAVAQAGRRFMDSHLEHMGRPSGLLTRGWMRDANEEIWEPDIKGHAWVIEGYLDAYRLSGESRYLVLARQLAAQVMACQAADGGWTYLFKRPAPGDPADDKATAIWAYLFFDLYKVTADPAHLAAARRALGWCLRHQYRGDDPHLDGAIFNSNSMAYVRRRPMTILYSTTFFGLALREELAVRNRERPNERPAAGAP